MPLSLVSPGPAPKTALQKVTMIESGHEVRFNTTDRKDVVMLVLAYNGVHHFTPTRVCTLQELNDFKVKELIAICHAGIDVIGSINVEGMSDNQQEFLATLGEGMGAATTAFPTVAAKPGKSGAGKGGKVSPFLTPPRVTRSNTPLLPHESPEEVPSDADGSHISLSESESAPGPSHQHMQSSTVSDTPVSATDEEPTLDSSKFYCNIGKCSNRAFSTKKGLNQHNKNIHLGIYRFNCPQCQFHHDSKSIYHQHMRTSHKVNLDQGKEFKCEKCGKVFQGQNLLSKHLKLDSCDKKGKKKNFQCEHCKKWYIAKPALLAHIEKIHTGKDLKYSCNLCDNKYSNSASLSAHMLVHKRAETLKKLKKQREQRRLHKSKGLMSPISISSASSPQPASSATSAPDTPETPAKEFTTKKPSAKKP